mmetsp:Transcript_39311/g.127217  ORF Transcript_39311/g.127217 Transcript_39311/m.127217 type:complete len:210 (+) Transcript_39311:868-1497(+)
MHGRGDARCRPGRFTHQDRGLTRGLDRRARRRAFQADQHAPPFLLAAKLPRDSPRAGLVPHNCGDASARVPQDHPGVQRSLAAGLAGRLPAGRARLHAGEHRRRRPSSPYRAGLRPARLWLPGRLFQRDGGARLGCLLHRRLRGLRHGRRLAHAAPPLQRSGPEAGRHPGRELPRDVRAAALRHLHPGGRAFDNHLVGGHVPRRRPGQV